MTHGRMKHCNTKSQSWRRPTFRNSKDPSLSERTIFEKHPILVKQRGYSANSKPWSGCKERWRGVRHSKESELVHAKKPKPLPPKGHEYLPPLRQKYGYCKRCARRSTPCEKCGHCYLCHPFKEMEEIAEYLYQQRTMTSYEV